MFALEKKGGTMRYVTSRIIIGLVLLMMGCAQNDPVERFNYPLASGHSWQYQRTWSIEHFSDSTGTVVPDSTATFESQIRVWIEEKAQLENGVKAFPMVGEEIGPDTIRGIEYYANREDGLYSYGYESLGPLIFPKEIRTLTSAGTLRLRGREFNSIAELSAWIQALASSFGLASSDSIIYEDPPLKVLAYPLEVGSRWTYREKDDPWAIEKQVTAIDTLPGPAGVYPVYTIRYLFDIDNDGNWDSDIVLYDYIGSVGLVMRLLSIRDIEWINEDGITQGLYNYNDKFILISTSVEATDLP